MNIRLTIIMALFLVFVGNVFAKNITGTVKDAKGEAIIGVSILVQNTKKGTISDIDGNFFLENIDENTILTVSYIGYLTKNVSVMGKTKLDIVLEEDSKTLDEVVVTGYSVQKRRDVSGAVSKVSTKELTALPVASAQLALQGRVAGMSVASQSGEPGANISVRIRGVGSISSSNDPLYIVDGIPVQSGISNLSPNDIDNITVLKDASSAAIYGSRANNGVVLVTTKSGVEGEAKVQYNSQFGLQQAGRLVPMTNTAQYIQIYNEAANNDNAGSVIKRPLLEGQYLNGLADVNYQDEIFRVAPMQQHEISISGGTKKTKYLFGVSYFDQQGIIINSNYDRFNVRTNVNSEVKNWLTVGANIGLSSSNRHRVASSGDGGGATDGSGNPDGGSVVRIAMYKASAIPVRFPDGRFTDMSSEYFGAPIYDTFFDAGYNPVNMCYSPDMSEKSKSLLASGNILIKLPNNFSIKSVMGVDYYNTTSRTFYEQHGTPIGGIPRIYSNDLNVSQTENTNFAANATLNHSFVLGGNHSFNWFVGSEMNIENAAILSGSEGEIADLNFVYLGKGNSRKNPYQSEWGSRLLSFFGTINYNYAQKYYLTLLLREDGSSRFAKGNRWGTFYSVAASWNIESEKFFAPALNTINKLKLRVGYGAIGNQNIGLYADKSIYAQSGYQFFGDTSYKAFIMSRLGNTDLKWETSNQFNAGVDIEFLKGSLGATVDYYYKITDNMLVAASYPPSVGNIGLPLVNNGSVLNTGVDIELFYRKNYKNGGFNIALNGGLLHNEVLALNASISAGRVDNGVMATRTVVGQPIGSFYLYEMEGIFQDNIDLMTSANQDGRGNRTLKPGDIKYKDNNKDGVIDANDRVFCGSSIPTFTTGLTLSGNYRWFDLSLFFQGAIGQKIYAQQNGDLEGFYRGFSVTERYFENHWTPENHSNEFPRASWNAKGNNARQGTTRFLEDGSYLRLKNVQIGFTMPDTKKIKIDNIRMYIAATNLLTLTKYYGLDPEITVSRNSESDGDRANGIDWGTYPVAQTFTFGINITF